MTTPAAAPVGAEAQPVTSSLQLPPSLRAALREHQIAALHFLWRRLVDEGVLQMAARTYTSTLEQRALLYQEVYGCIIGHSMGLGKTLTALSFVLLLQAQMMLMGLKRRRQQEQQLQRGRHRTGSSTDTAFCPSLRVIVVCPKSTVHHWVNSASEWVTPALFGRVTLSFCAPGALSARQLEAALRAFHTDGGVLVLGYEEYTRLTKALGKRLPHEDWNGDRVWSLLDRVRQRLPLRPKVRYIDVLEGADVVVLDEAHRLKRSASVLVQSLRRHLRNVQVRVALTGTPLQNHLEEYNVMQSVVTGSDLDSHQFLKYFVRPIQLGQCADSSLQQFTEMQRCVNSLRRYFAATVHHCGPEELERALPPRKEFVFFFSLSKAQEEAYRTLLESFTRAQAAAGESGSSALVLHHEASHICLHPSLASESEAVRPPRRTGVSGQPSALPVGRRGDQRVVKGTEDPGRTKEEDSDTATDEDGLDFVEDLAGEEAAASAPSGAGVNAADSPKLLFALELVDYITKTRGEKVVVFSLYLSHLRLMQSLIQQRMDPSQQDIPHIFSGDTTEAQRAAYTADFQNNQRQQVMLCSVRAGGVGINLTAANHCVLLDVSWNPADDTQATYRVFRFGQQKPVFIYRLATHGTTEQVVFAYALQKSWMHKKIVDITDPTRQERHMKRSYFSYPCRVPIDDGAPFLWVEPTKHTKPTATEKSKGSPFKGSTTAEEEVWEQEARSLYFLGLCEKECPVAAAVLHTDPALRTRLYSVVQRSFLLRDDSAEAIAEMESRFREAQRRREAQMPIALVDTDDSLVVASRPGARRGSRTLLEDCEIALVDTARTAANHLLWWIMQRRHDTGRESTEGADTTAIVREADRQLCQLLSPLIQLSQMTAAREATAKANTFSFQNASPSALPTGVALAASSPTCLAEIFLYLYQEGARHAVTDVLAQSAFTKLRTYLTSRIPRETFAASSRRPRRSTLTHGVLEDALLHQPYDLLSRVDAVEQTYVATEMGFVRPFVEQCFVMGLRQCVARLSLVSPTQGLGEEEEQIVVGQALRTLLKEFFCVSCGRGGLATTDADSSSGEEEEVAATRSHSGTTVSQTELTSGRLEVVLPQLVEVWERCLSDLWPSGAGFTLPSPCMELHKEEARTRAAFQSADRAVANTGFFRASEAAVQLGLQRSAVRSTLFTCPRCRSGLLQRTADTTLGCAECHYNAEFALRNDIQCQQPVALFQLSFTCNLLDTFSTSRSFSTSFAPSSCSGVWEALLKLRVGHPMVHLVERCTTDGMDIVLSEYPPKFVQLLSVQSGAGTDVDTLRRMLWSNAALVWSHSLRKHVKDGLALCFRDLVEPCAIARFASMPLMAIILSLHLAARHEEVHFAADLLDGGELASNMYAASATGGPKRTLLRFVCDCLVKLLYVEKLLEHCREPPAVKTEAIRAAEEAAAAAAMGTSSGGGGFSDMDALSLLSASQTPSRSPSLAPAAPPLSALLRQPSSSPSSCDTSSTDNDAVSSASSFAPCSLPPSSAAPSRSPSQSSSSSSSSLGTARHAPPQGRQPLIKRQRRETHPSALRPPTVIQSEDGKETDADGAAPREPRDDINGSLAPEPEADEEVEEKTAEQLEDEATLEQRSAQYWVAFCEVYGTRTVESLTVFVEDEELGMTILPPPPPLFWVSQLLKASKDGKTVSEVIDVFLQKLLELSHNTRLITQE